jgi:hypothetical protein
MNYTPEQFTQAVLKALESLNDPDLSKLPLQERKDLAENPNTPPEILSILARDTHWNVRCEVAKNPNTPPETLTILARDKDVYVRRRVANNPNTPPEILTILAQDMDCIVRWGVERNPNYNQEVVLKTQLKALKTHIAAVQHIIDNIRP